MQGTKSYPNLSPALCILVAIGVALSYLALNDIYHAIESNLETEWWIVRNFFLMVGCLVVSTSLISIKLFNYRCVNFFAPNNSQTIKLIKRRSL